MTNIFQFSVENVKKACKKNDICFFVGDGRIFIAVDSGLTYMFCDNFEKDGCTVTSHKPAYIKRLDHDISTCKELCADVTDEAPFGLYLAKSKVTPMEFFFEAAE